VGIISNVIDSLWIKKNTPINEVRKILGLSDLKVGDRLKFLQKLKFIKIGDVYEVTNFRSSPNVGIVILKIKKDGNASSSRVRGNSLFVGDGVLRSWISRNVFVVLDKEEAMNSGEIKVEDIKRIIVNLGIKDDIGLPMNKVLYDQNGKIFVVLGYKNNSIINIIHKKFTMALKSNNIIWEDMDKISIYPDGSIYVVIDKFQGVK